MGKSVADGKATLATSISACVPTASDASFATLNANMLTAFTNNYNSGWTNGVTDADNRANINSVNYQTGYNSGRTQGQNDVTNSPNSYGLYTATQYNDYGVNQFNIGKANASVKQTISKSTTESIPSRSNKKITISFTHTLVGVYNLTTNAFCRIDGVSISNGNITVNIYNNNADALSVKVTVVGLYQ